jgi:DNA polymerase V
MDEGSYTREGDAPRGLISAAWVEGFELPLALARLTAGFPSPAEDYVEQDLDVGRYLVRRPGTTFFMRVEGDSMTGENINDGDLLVIDRAERVGDGAIVVARVNDEFCVKQLRVIDGRPWLYPANDNYFPIEITEEMDFEIWGRVTYSITSHCASGSPLVTKIK